MHASMLYMLLHTITNYVNYYSCINTYAHTLSNKRKSMFKSWCSHVVWTWVLTLHYFKWVCMIMYGISVVAQTHYFTVVFVCEKAAHDNAIVTSIWHSKFTVDTFLFGESIAASCLNSFHGSWKMIKHEKYAWFLEWFIDFKAWRYITFRRDIMW